tara:strand:+ start:1281 stop:1394 length:114 start_codon:yes stop_codon:yes gene_type:complete
MRGWAWPAASSQDGTTFLAQVPENAVLDAGELMQVGE